MKISSGIFIYNISYAPLLDCVSGAPPYFSGKNFAWDFILVNPRVVMYDKKGKQGGVYEAA